jgi:hypothetical protein
MFDRSLRLGVCVAALASSAACSAVPTDATWVGTNPYKNEFSDKTNWSPPIVPTNIATIPSTAQPPQPGQPQVSVSKPVQLRGIRQTGGFIYGSSITLTGEAWSICGKYSSTFMIGTVAGNVRLCPGPAIDFGYAQIGLLIADVSVLGGGFGPGQTGPGPPSNLQVTGSVVVDQTGGLVAWVSTTDKGILDVQGTISIKGSATTLLVGVPPTETARSITAIPIRAKGGITGQFSSVIVNNQNYRAEPLIQRDNEIQVTVTRLGPSPRGQAPAAPRFIWPPSGPLPIQQ